MQYVAALPIVLSAFIELSQSAVQCPAKLRQSEGIAAFIAIRLLPLWLSVLP